MNSLRKLTTRWLAAKALFQALAAWLVLAAPLAAQATDYPARKAEAETLYAEKSYAAARAVYEALDPRQVPPEETRWVAFRLADAGWRVLAAQPVPDYGKLADMRRQLERLADTSLFNVDGAASGEAALWDAPAGDPVAAAAYESLGDSFARENGYGQVWFWYQRALDVWASTTEDLASAREHYRNLVRKVWAFEDEHPGSYFSIPAAVADNFLTIAETPEDRALAHFALARAWMAQGGDAANRSRATREFEAVLQAGPSFSRYDAALYYLAEWAEHSGKLITPPAGPSYCGADPEQAVALYRRLLAEFAQGQSRFRNAALSRLNALESKQLRLQIDHVFLPGSQPEITLTTQNLGTVTLTLYKLDLLSEAFETVTAQPEGHEFLLGAKDAALTQIKAWDEEMGTNRPYQMLSRPILLPGANSVGAYLLVARSGSMETRELVLVSDLALAGRTADRTVLFAGDAASGEPAADLDIRLWQAEPVGRSWRWTSRTGRADAGGMVVFDGPAPVALAVARSGDRAAFADIRGAWSDRFDRDAERVYAFTDRPAYRPGETVHWKIVLRKSEEGKLQPPPAGLKVKYSLVDPNGNALSEGEAALNTFGSAWGSLALKADASLGVYGLRLEDPDGWDLGQNAFTLFRVEEYKLPEFTVKVNVPRTGGKRMAFRQGESVNLDVEARYLHGAPAADAAVTVVVNARTFSPAPPPGVEPETIFTSAAAWMSGRNDNMGWELELRTGSTYYSGAPFNIPAQVFTGRTDAQGFFHFTFSPPELTVPTDLLFGVEAQVTDLARREQTGSGSVVVSNRPCWVYPHSERTVARTGETVPIELRAIDADGAPVAAAGRLVVERAEWGEVWADPDGKRYADEALAAVRRASPSFPPPPPGPGCLTWNKVEEKFAYTEVQNAAVATDATGRGSGSFWAAEAGLYRVRWVGTNPQTMPWSAETAIWVSDGGSIPGVPVKVARVLFEKKTYRAGETARALVLAPEQVRAALATVEAGRIHQAATLQPHSGSALLEWPVSETQAPRAALVLTWLADGTVNTVRETVAVTPADRALRVKVHYPKPIFQPGEKAVVDIVASDPSGAPVSAEVALAVVDDAIFAFEQDASGDPGECLAPVAEAPEARPLNSFGWRPYARIVPLPAPPEVKPGDPTYTLIGGDRGQVEGTVKDTAGGTIPGATLTLTGAAGTRIGVTDDSGQFRFSFLVPGSYALKAELIGFKLYLLRNLQVRPGESVFLSIPLSPGEVSDIVSVKAEAPLVDLTCSRVGAVCFDAVGVLDAVQARRNFSTTAFWTPSVVTGEDGRAKVEITFPDNLTAWRAVARGLTRDNRFGLDRESVARTRKPLAIRLETPRFLTQGDQATVSALVDNLSNKPLDVSAALFADGQAVPNGRAAKAAGNRLTIPAGTTVRVDWTVAATRPGELRLKAAVKAEGQGDAEEKRLPVFEHGLEKLLATSGKLAGEALTLTLDIPTERQRETTRLVIRTAPSLAGVMLDALPYLVDYPYGCTEQTMSRFLPAVVAARTLRDLGLPAETVKQRLDAVVAASAGAAETAPFSAGADKLGQLDDVVRKGLERLADFQHADGGWGWWKDGASDPFMSAYVVWGLALAQGAGAPVSTDRLRQGQNFLEMRLVDAEVNFELQAWLLQAVAAARAALAPATPPQSTAEAAAPAVPSAASPTTAPAAGKSDDFAGKAFENLWNARDQLSAYSQGLLLLAARDLGRTDRMAVLARNLANGARVVPPEAGSPAGGTPETASWGKATGYFNWFDGAVESTATVLRALLAADPRHPLAAPAMAWLVRNRHGARWSNTRDTALSILALTDWLKASREMESELAYEVQLNGRTLARQKVAKGEAPFAALRLDVPAEAVRGGANTVRLLRLNGTGPLYASAEARFFSLEEPLTPATHEVGVTRRYFRQASRSTLFKGKVATWEPLADGAVLASGDKVLTIIDIEAKNDLEYLCLEDLKPAGLETVETKSGQGVILREVSADGRHFLGRSCSAYCELRDRKVATFVSRLPQGRWEIRTEMRAEAPGTFHALPALAHAMYVPDIRGNSTETRLKVTD